MEKVKPVTRYSLGYYHGMGGESGSYLLEADDGKYVDFAAYNELQAELDRLTQALDACHAESVQRWRSLLSAKAKIDALMFEHCPDEMTPAQIEEWNRHQVPVNAGELTGE